MNNPKDFEIDLLRNRRIDLGIDNNNIVANERDLLKKGYLIGFGIVGFILGLFLLLTIYQNKVKSKKNSLEDVVKKYEAAQSKLFQTNAQINNIKTSNKALAKEIIKIGSFSALIEETSRIIPQSIQLEKIKFEKGDILFKANVDNDLGLYEIIAFKLNLQSSKFFKKDSVVLQQASQQITNTNFGDKLKKLSFSFTAKVENNPIKLYGKNISTDYLRNLGAEGLAERIELIKQENLL